MKYLSLFSGIGGFEVAIHKKWPDAECIGYSEIKPHAIKVYEHHYPGHTNLGDITKITDEQLLDLVEVHGGCDLIVGGFPCTNLSSMASFSGNHDGLQGPKSGLFYDMVRVIKILKPKYVLIENNYSMNKTNRKIITDILSELFEEPIYMTMINAADFGVQTRKRLYWTNFEINDIERICEQTWDNILEPIDIVYQFKVSYKMAMCFNKFIERKSVKNITKIVRLIENDTYEFSEVHCEKKQLSRWELSTKSDNMNTQLYTPYTIGKSRPILATFGNILLDRRSQPGFIIRYFSQKEMERLFWFPDDYTNIIINKKHISDILGNSVVVRVIEYFLSNIH